MSNLLGEISYESKNFVDKAQFMTTLEQYIYVTPKNKHSDVPTEYKTIIDSFTDSFPDMNELTEKIWTGTDNSKYIESKRISYFAKSNLKSVKFPDYNEFMGKFNSLRKDDIIKYEEDFIKNF